MIAVAEILDGAKQVSLYDYRPGDIILIQYPPGRPVKREELEDLQRTLESYLKREVKIIGLPHDMELLVMRPKESAT